ncbi:hypothetical protein D9758_010963 [Tetrapyrgos nigripes]|uniref:Transcription factor domain-containing protein n=1 Tax=Tetrapyrgos nigripes TaxID=182062 RepID=A0A8H5LPV6_9AGAR|nr:hypothetical protein D9758_010963 [Tetrapyrgos nigripes]
MIHAMNVVSTLIPLLNAMMSAGNLKMVVRLAEKPSKIAYWNAYMRLTEIYGFALLTIYSVQKNVLGSRIGIGNGEWYEKAVMAIDSGLNEWMGLVPEHLRCDKRHDDPIFFTQSTLLFCWYHWIQIAVHKRFIPRPRDHSTSSLPSLSICNNAARSSLRLCETFMKRLGNYHSQLLATMYHSATVLALNLVRSLQLRIKIDPRKEIMDIYKFIDLFRFYERASPHAGRLVDILSAMMFASPFPPQLSVSMSNFDHPAQQPRTAELQGTTLSQPSLPLSSPGHISSHTEGWSPEPIQPLSSAFSTSYPKPNSSFPFYSSDLGKYDIQASLHSVNESSIANYDDPSAEANKSSSISPDVHQYFSLFDESTMINTNSE